MATAAARLNFNGALPFHSFNPFCFVDDDALEICIVQTIYDSVFALRDRLYEWHKKIRSFYEHPITYYDSRFMLLPLELSTNFHAFSMKELVTNLYTSLCCTNLTSDRNPQSSITMVLDVHTSPEASS